MNTLTYPIEVVVHGLLGFNDKQLDEISNLLKDPLKVNHLIHSKNSMHVGKYGKYMFKWNKEVLNVRFAFAINHSILKGDY